MLKEKSNLGVFLVTAAALVLTSVGLCRGAFGLESGPRAAQFSYETNPSKVILFVCSPRTDKGIDSMTLYGDGRLEVRAEGGEQGNEQFVLRPDKQETEALIRVAVDHGLAEYDSDRIREEQLRRSGRLSQSEGAKVTTVLLSLASYEGHDKRPEGVEQVIRLESPDLAARSIPGVPEIRGVAELRRRMIELGAMAETNEAQPLVEPDYSVAQFTFSSDPGRVILSVTCQAGLIRRKTSMFVHGDGRTELRVEGGDQGREHYEVFLEYSDVQALLALAVSHGLAEYDNTNVHARQLRKLLGRPYTGPEDGSRLTVFLALASYSRGSYARNGVKKSIGFEAPWLAARAFPEIPEIRGILELQRRLFGMLDRARKQREGGQ